MIFPIILHHDSSQEYTNALIKQLEPRTAFIINSSVLGTHFTDSFNLALEAFLASKFSHAMICNNDIDLDYDRLIQLENAVKNKKGIFSPIVNSPHAGVMHKQGDAVQRKVPWVEFVCPIISKSVVKKIGVLDTGMPRGWGIELDYCYRAKQVGFSTNLIQTVSVHHYGGKSYSNREEHCHLSSNEMHSRLIEKYGENWYGILEYPQW
jgi:hypothetical protein